MKLCIIFLIISFCGSIYVILLLKNIINIISSMKNSRCPLVLKNRTKYFDASRDKVRFSVSSPDSFRFGQSKMEGYETRLYYEFKRTQELGGQTFFYTLTYCEAKIPKYEGHNCFDYEDLRQLLTGAFRKVLLRKYGAQFRYFVGAELGDGKGSRGLHNNPHYHILFFIRPSDKPVILPYVHEEIVGEYVRRSKYHNVGDLKYKKVHEKVEVPFRNIEPEEFRHLLRLYWQGFDQDEARYDFRDSLFGIVKEGKFDLGVVKDFRAISYVSKYCIKDVHFKNVELSIREDCGLQFENEYRDSFQSYVDFLHSRIYYLYNIPLNARHTAWQWNDKELCWKLVPHLCKSYTLFEDWLPSWVADCVKGIIATCDLQKDYEEFIIASREEFVHCKLVEFRNRYSNKVRISQEVGSSALEEVTDSMNPFLRIPSKDGYKFRNLPVYLYRKMYTEIYTDIKGHTTRILSDLGVKYKLATLEKNLEKIRSNARCILGALNRDLFELVVASDVNTDIYFDFDFFHLNYSRLLVDFSVDDMLFRYSLYKVIYNERYIKNDSPRLAEFAVHSSLDYVFDYSSFLEPSCLRVRRSDTRLSRFLENDMENYTAYGLLPYFNRFLFLFSVLDCVSDYLFVETDRINQEKAESIAAVRRLHKAIEMQTYVYLNF